MNSHVKVRILRLGSLVGKNGDHNIWHENIWASLLENFEMLNIHYSLGLSTFNIISDVGHVREEVRLKSYEQKFKKWS